MRSKREVMPMTDRMKVGMWLKENWEQITNSSMTWIDLVEQVKSSNVLEKPDTMKVASLSYLVKSMGLEFVPKSAKGGVDMEQVSQLQDRVQQLEEKLSKHTGPLLTLAKFCLYLHRTHRIEIPRHALKSEYGIDIEHIEALAGVPSPASNGVKPR